MHKKLALYLFLSATSLNAAVPVDDSLTAHQPTHHTSQTAKTSTGKWRPKEPPAFLSQSNAEDRVVRYKKPAAPTQVNSSTIDQQQVHEHTSLTPKRDDLTRQHEGNPAAATPTKAASTLANVQISTLLEKANKIKDNPSIDSEYSKRIKNAVALVEQSYATLGQLVYRYDYANARTNGHGAPIMSKEKLLQKVNNSTKITESEKDNALTSAEAAQNQLAAIVEEYSSSATPHAAAAALSEVGKESSTSS